MSDRSLSQLAMASAAASRSARYLDGLNPPQREAVEALEGPVLMLAGAGTGKTRALTARIAHLIATGTARPNEILAVTFTNKAAREMKLRIGSLLGDAVEGMPWLGTFHSIGVKFLRRHAELVGLKPNFTILDTDDQLRLMKQLIQAWNMDEKRWPARALASVIDGWKNRAWRPEAETRLALCGIWEAMRDCVAQGIRNEGVLPGGLKVRRRAPLLHQRLVADKAAPGLIATTFSAMDWVNLYALAVNEENAAGGRMVTAPTNGAAGIIPAVLHYYMDFQPGAGARDVVDFLLAAGAVGILCKKNASISGAEVGCQGEVGSACAMAAAGLAEVMGASPQQVENAAEIGLEHNLGLTCDPIGGLVQVPCIERNAIAAVKAINAAQMALRGDGEHFVSLDKAIRTMRDTGRDMLEKYKETSRGGLAVSFIEC